jgi:hypothetical protein|tara:strand:- start:1926 stop:2129 length:204 start_codon:yes stop_codon:yes gene_type:complete
VGLLSPKPLASLSTCHLNIRVYRKGRIQYRFVISVIIVLSKLAFANFAKSRYLVRKLKQREQANARS